MSKVEALEAKLAESRAKRAEAEEAQYEEDLGALLELEEEHGAVASVKVSRFVAGQPTRAFLRTPNAAEYKRYKDLIFRAQMDKNAKTSAVSAQEQLAKSCWIYPSGDEAQASMLAAFPGLLSSIGLAATSLAEGKAEEVGKD
jgi:hypothetical protein